MVGTKSKRHCARVLSRERNGFNHFTPLRFGASPLNTNSPFDSKWIVTAQLLFFRDRVPTQSFYFFAVKHRYFLPIKSGLRQSRIFLPAQPSFFFNSTAEFFFNFLYTCHFLCSISNLNRMRFDLKEDRQCGVPMII